jgi:hypothetical protein
MTEVTYFVALPFVAADDGVAAGEPTAGSASAVARTWSLVTQTISPRLI